MSVPFDQYQRYKNAQLIIESARREGETFRILEVGANEHRNLEKFLPNDDITYLDISLPDELLGNPKYILGDASDMDFEDNYFDIVVALDVYEHVFNDRKEEFIKELHRVASRFFVLCAPFYSERVVGAEQRTNQVYKTIFGSDYIWLKEHRDNILPQFNELLDTLEKNNVNFEWFSHGDTDCWEQLMNVHFFSVMEEGLVNYCQCIDSYYDEKIFENDYSENGYRNFVVGKKLDFQFNFRRVSKLPCSDSYLNNLVSIFYNLVNVKKSDLVNANIINSIQQPNQKNRGLFCQIYYGDKGEFSEEFSIREDYTEYDGNSASFTFEFGQELEWVSEIRIDPLNAKGIVDFQSIKMIDMDGESISVLEGDFQTNADFVVNGNIFMFKTEDSNIFVKLKNFRLKYIMVNINSIIIRENGINFFNGIYADYTSRKNELNKAFKEIETSKQELNATSEELENCRQKLNATSDELENCRQKLNATGGELERYKKDCGDLTCKVSQLLSEYLEKDRLYNDIQNAFFWRATKPLRSLCDSSKGMIRKHKVLLLLGKGVVSLKKEGVKNTSEKVKRKFMAKKECGNLSNKLSITAEQREIQGQTMFNRNIKFSILVPLFNTPDSLLIEMIDSIINQTYHNWELCLADGSNENEERIMNICINYSQKDERIKYEKLEKNLGISGNTNECAKMALGDYMVLVDHDDLVLPNALYENAIAIEETDADILYSDEDHITENGEHINPFYKPDWSPDLLYSQMYICHLLVFKKEVFETVGGFNSKFDGSQDYDIMLRMTEITTKICHIPKILYSWRETATSTAANPEAKPYAHTSGLNALSQHLIRKYGNGYAEETGHNFVYEARFNILNNPLVSIIIPMKDKWELTQQCIISIFEKTSYKNFEIILLDNNSVEKETLNWFGNWVKKEPRIKLFKAEMEFNWSKLNNFGIKCAMGDVYIFLNNDTVVLDGDWLEKLTENALREDIGVVGPLLLYEDGTIQHAGVVVGMGGWADHVFKGMRPIHYGSPFVSPTVNRNVLAVTGACMAISRNTIKNIGGFDENFIICGSDVEICVRAYKHGLNNLYLASTKLYHLESKSRDSFIPEMDFVQSEACYREFKENIDPYFNINLDIYSPVPKESGNIMKVNYKNYFLRNKLAKAVYHKIEELAQEIKEVNYNIAEVEPMSPRKDDYEVKDLRLNLLVPSVNKKHVFGGIATALEFFNKLVQECDVESRIIVTDSGIDLAENVALDGYELIDCMENSKQRRQLVAFGDRHNKTISVRENDVFMATGWWTAYIVAPVIKWQQTNFEKNNYKLIYFIQDFEPGFYPWSSRYLMADSTYALDISTVAIFNSKELKEYFEKNGYKFASKFHFEPVLNKSLYEYLLQHKDEFDRKKQIIVYGRPSTHRNAFELVVAILKTWVQNYNNAKEWEVLSLGEVHSDIELGNGVKLVSKGKLPLEEYGKTMLTSSIGISLMVSPHPSYPPLEMSTFGVKTITNCYENKDLGTFNKNIVSVKNCSQDKVAKILTDLCEKYSPYSAYDYNEEYAVNKNTFESIIKEIKLILQ